MKQILIATLLAALSGSRILAQPVQPAESHTFELSPVAPPTPALKYQLLFDNASDRKPGNAAILYLQSILLMGPDTKQNAQQALEAFNSGDLEAFRSLADSLGNENFFAELDLAGRREECDWQPPIRERGVETLLPHLEPLRHGVAKAIKVRALRQIEQGQVEDALVTLRLGYELGDKIGTEPVLVSALVSVSTTGAMNDALTHAMNRPESPSLYWALVEMPSSRRIFRRAYDGERRFLLASVPNLAKWKSGTSLTAEEWRELLGYISKFARTEGETQPPDPIHGATPDNVRQAQRGYAAAHHLSESEAAQVDPTIVLGEFYFNQYEAAGDEFYMLRGMPWPMLTKKSREFDAKFSRLKGEQPANPFLLSLPQLAKVSWAFVRADRELAALTAVEAIRSYAATHDGKLPAQLADVTDTPVPDNPATSAPFDYHVDGSIATLADSTSEVPLTYTIKIRQENVK